MKLARLYAGFCWKLSRINSSKRGGHLPHGSCLLADLIVHNQQAPPQALSSYFLHMYLAQSRLDTN